MEPGIISDSQVWTDPSGHVINWFPNGTRLNVQGPARTTHQSDGQQWLEVDLGERKYITGIVTTGSTHPNFPFYLESYKVAFSKDRKKWKTYKESHSGVEKVFDGNTNYRQLTRNNFIPATVGRYMRVIPQRWKRRIAVKMELIGCQQVRSITSYKPRPTPRADILEKYSVNNTDPIVTKDNNLGRKLAATMSPIIIFVILLILGICIFRNLTNKKTEESFGTSSPPKSGCWKQFKSCFVRPQLTEFTVSYSHEKEALQKLDVVRSDLSDYEQHLMVGAGTVARKGSTFKPIDAEGDEGIGQTESMNHYVIPLVPNRHEYAEPLTNQEPEYATPIVETVRHLSHSLSHSLSACTSETPYNVPVTTLTKKSSFSQLTNSTIESNIPNCNGLHPKSVVYQIPQGITDCSKNEKAGYDRPTCNSTFTAGEVVGTTKTQS
uniref:Discoidin, CUB and LCCL domain-containing protein 1-like protein n=1 Tax=Callorhinchus milii TaxID=7868 RepID=V9KGH3_CALMI